MSIAPSLRSAIVLTALVATFSACRTPRSTSGNPVFEGWYADPEGVVLDGRYWVFPTSSAPYDEQVGFDAFSSPDLVHWTKHERVLDTSGVRWAVRAMW